jgi:hypothetical protein
MLKLSSILSCFIIASGQPTFAQTQSLSINTGLAFHSKLFLGLDNEFRSTNNGKLNFGVKYNTNNSESQLALNYDGYNNFNLDRTYLQYTQGIATFGVGAINRNWSFSNNTSLILSHNARPSKSIYLELKNKFGYEWLPSDANWSIELFNGFTKGSLNKSKSMLLGARAVISPIESLDIELVQTSQWGGKDYSSGISALGAAIISDTNKNFNDNINKMAGFGISYLVPSEIMPLRIYAQAIGEDEAGNLPSCYTYLAGIEWTGTKNKYPTTVSIETVDTRIDKTKHGYCGPNTMYNNNTYKYTNYGKTMGAEIDSEGTSIGISILSQISQNIKIELATKSMVINDKNWQFHRLSSKRQSGLINSLGVSWVKENITFNGNIHSQGFNLDKASIKSGYGINFSSSVTF